MLETSACLSALNYDLVIATRNRPDALALSLPLMVAQSRPPRRLIVVDASDAPKMTAHTVAQATEGWSGEVILRRSAPGLPRQRNLGLRDVTAPVVFFFDDDSLPHPEAASAIMEVYERDSEGVIAAVAAAETKAPPEGVLPDDAWRMTGAHRREARLRRLRNRIERHLTALKPALYLGRVLNARHRVPGWLKDMNVVPVEYMTGFRMTFRTAAIRQAGFDENLAGYALDEDIDASFTAMEAGLVVGARRAQVFHHRRPGGRGKPQEIGRMVVLNRAYVLLKHASGSQGSDRLVRGIWRRHKIFMALQVLALLPRLSGHASRERLSGVLSGIGQSLRLRHGQPVSAHAKAGAQKMSIT